MTLRNCDQNFDRNEIIIVRIGGWFDFVVVDVVRRRYRQGMVMMMTMVMMSISVTIIIIIIIHHAHHNAY